MRTPAELKVRDTLVAIIDQNDKAIEAESKSPTMDPDASYALNLQRHERRLSYLTGMNDEIRVMLEKLNLLTR
jgi:hypothetical protein